MTCGNTSDFIGHLLPKHFVSAHGATHHAWAPGSPSKTGANKSLMNWSVINVVCYQMWSVMNMVCYELVCYERVELVCYEHGQHGLFSNVVCMNGSVINIVCYERGLL